MSEPIRELDAVALAEPIPGQNLQRGHVGTVVHQYPDGTLEVEFSDSRGVAYAFATVQPDLLIRLCNEPPRAKAV